MLPKVAKDKRTFLTHPPSFTSFYLFIFIGVLLLYTAMPVSAVKLSEFAIHMRMFGFPSHLGPCAIGKALISYLFNTVVILLHFRMQDGRREDLNGE